MRPPTFAAILALVLTLLAAPAGATSHGPIASNGTNASGTFAALCFDCFHCPYHPDHCGYINLTSANGSVKVSATIGGGGSDVMPVTLATNATATLILQATRGDAQAETKQDLFVRVEPLLGIEWTASMGQNLSFASDGTGRVAFPFQLAQVWPAGDLLFPAFVVSDGAEQAVGYAAIRVGEPGGADTPLAPALALLALLGGAALVGARRRRA